MPPSQRQNLVATTPGEHQKTNRPSGSNTHSTARLGLVEHLAEPAELLIGQKPLASVLWYRRTSRQGLVPYARSPHVSASENIFVSTRSTRFAA